MLLLINYYKKYMKNKRLVATENILKWTNQYKEDTDIYLCFLNECTEQSDIHIRTSTLYNSFKKWFTEKNPKTIVPSNKAFIINIKRYKTIEKIRDGNSVANGIKKLKIVN